MEITLERIHEYFIETYYTSLLPIAFGIYSLLILGNKREIPFILERRTYLISTLILFGGGIFLDATNILFKIRTAQIINLSNILFSILETLVFVRILLVLIPNNVLKKYITVLYCTILVVGGVVIYHQVLLSDWKSTKWAHYFATVQLYMLVILCLYYFYQVYKANKDFDFSNTLIVFALLCYSIVSIPYFLLAFYLDYKHSIDGMFYAIHYFLIAFLCFSLSLNNPTTHKSLSSKGISA